MTRRSKFVSAFLPLSLCLLSNSDAIAEHIATASDPESYSVLRLFEFEFSLTADQSVETHPPVLFESPLVIGNAGGEFSESGVQGDFTLRESFGPTNPFDLDGKFHIRIFGGVSSYADLPPVSYALFIQEVTGFFTFRNYSEQMATIPLSYHGTYSLLALGATSSAMIDLEARTTPEGGDPVETTLISDSITNDMVRDARVPADGEGTLLITLDPATVIGDEVIPTRSDLRLELTTRADAEVTVPEPSVLVVLGTGAFATLLFYRKRGKSLAQPRQAMKVG